MASHIRPQATVDRALLLSDLGFLDRETAEMCRVSVKTVRRWRRLYQRRGLPRGPSRPPCPRCDGGELDREAYTYLLGLYLGDGHLAAARRGVYLLSISQDSRYAGLVDECLTTMRAVKPGAHPHLRHGKGCTKIECSSTHWPCLFPQHGPGPKHRRRIELEPWQQDLVEADPRPFVRGLIHSDGCRMTNWTEKTIGGQRKRYEYPRYFFSNRSEDILGLCTWALDLLGIAWRRNGRWSVSVARREAVAALDAFVGPKY